MITWTCKYFTDLDNEELYRILQLRNEVFIVEQNCCYQDLDNKDLHAYHFCGWKENNLVAYTRLLAKGISYSDAPSIGRVLTSPSVRGQKVGKELMQRSIEETYRLFGKTTIKISAQLYLKKFYESFSFVQKGDVYLEDNIDHISMIRKFEGKQ
jgi:ElaA protein